MIHYLKQDRAPASRNVPITLPRRVSCFHDLAVDIQLLLICGGVADAYGPGTAVAVQVGELVFGNVWVAIDPIQHLEVRGPAFATAIEPLHELIHLLDEAQLVKGVDQD